MKLVLPNIDHIFEHNGESVNEIIIENQALMREILMDLYGQINGLEGKAVLSDKDKPIPISKNIEIVDRFVPFELNKKALLNKISSELEKRTANPEMYSNTLELLSKVEKYLFDLSLGMTGDIMFSSVNISALVKSSGITLNEEYESLGEKIIDYIELVTEYDNRSKVFIFVGIRSYLDDTEMDAFIDTICRQGYLVTLIEPVEHLAIQGTKRYIIDKDLCEIG